MSERWGGYGKKLGCGEAAQGRLRRVCLKLTPTPTLTPTLTLLLTLTLPKRHSNPNPDLILTLTLPKRHPNPNPDPNPNQYGAGAAEVVFCLLQSMDNGYAAQGP